MKHDRQGRRLMLALGLLLASAGAACAAGEPVMLERQENFMYSPVTITVWAADQASGERAANQGGDEFRRIEQLFSVDRHGSEVSALNQSAGRQPVPVSEETIRVLQWARQISELTDGAFDVTVAGYAWEYGFGQGDYRVPLQPRLDQIKKLVSYKYVMLYPDDKVVVFKREGVQLDLGGIARTYALNRVRDVLRRARVRAALVNVGGDVTVIGTRPGGGPWQVGVRHPRDPKRLLAVIPLTAGKVLSCGDYERYFERAGTRYHHILDPKTGKPASYSMAATLLLPEKPKVDLPAVALMLLPPEKVLRIVESIPGAACLIVDKDRQVWLSQRWKDTLKITW